MIDFKIQRFAGGGGEQQEIGTVETTYTGPRWAWFADDSDASNSYFGFIPSGQTIDLSGSPSPIADPDEPSLTPSLTGLSTSNDNGVTTLQIRGLDHTYVPAGDDTSASATLADGNTVDDVTVTGSAASGFTLRIDGTEYTVGNGGKLVEVVDEVIISSSIINTTQRNGKNVTKNIPYINPEASDSDVATFINALNGLSSNTTIKGGIVRVNKHAIG